MTITRITSFEARPDQVNQFKQFLGSIVSSVLSAPGCSSCRVLQNQENQNEFVCIEEWNSVEDHMAAAATIPPEMIQSVVALLAKAPSGAYFSA